MSKEQATTEIFTKSSNHSLRAEDLFLPSVLDIVKYMAQIAAEEDYKHFLATGEIPHTATHDAKEVADG